MSRQVIKTSVCGDEFVSTFCHPSLDRYFIHLTFNDLKYFTSREIYQHTEEEDKRTMSMFLTNPVVMKFLRSENDTSDRIRTNNGVLDLNHALFTYKNGRMDRYQYRLDDRLLINLNKHPNKFTIWRVELRLNGLTKSDLYSIVQMLCVFPSVYSVDLSNNSLKFEDISSLEIFKNYEIEI